MDGPAGVPHVDPRLGDRHGACGLSGSSPGLPRGDPGASYTPFLKSVQDDIQVVRTASVQLPSDLGVFGTAAVLVVQNRNPGRYYKRVVFASEQTAEDGSLEKSRWTVDVLPGQEAVAVDYNPRLKLTNARAAQVSPRDITTWPTADAYIDVDPSQVGSLTASDIPTLALVAPGAYIGKGTATLRSTFAQRVRVSTPALAFDQAGAVVGVTEPVEGADLSPGNAQEKTVSVRFGTSPDVNAVRTQVYPTFWDDLPCSSPGPRSTAPSIATTPAR